MAEIPQLVEKLEYEGRKLIDFFSSLSDAQWTTEIYTEGEVWTIRNVLAHFVTAERAFLTQLFPNVLEGKGGVREDFSIERFNRRQQEKTRELTANGLVDQFRAVRAGMIEWVSHLNEPDLGITGRHPFLGESTLLEMIKTVYIHNITHMRDIRKALGSQPD